MKTYKKWFILGFLLLAVTVGMGTAVYADISAGYTLSKSVVAGGGHQASTGGGYSLSGTAGETAVDTVSGGSYTLNSGFWINRNTSYGIYLPMILRQ